MTLKYPLFIIGTVVLTGVILSVALTVFSSNALENEITKRGLGLAKIFSNANAPLLLAGDKSKLQLAINTLLADADVVDATVVNHRGVVVATRNPDEIGKPYADFNVPLEPSTVVVLPSATHSDAKAVFGFVAPMKFGEVPLGVLLLKLSRKPISLATSRASLAAVIVGLLTALAISIGALVAVRHETRVIEAMQGALVRQAQGQFNVRLPEVRQDEYGDLARAFNKMANQIELFFHYVDKSIVDRLVADPSLAKPGGQLKELAVVFGDMRGYTSMSNRRTAQEVVRIINAYFYLFIEIVRAFGGVVDKTMGDAVMTIFERPNDDIEESYKRRAVLATAHMKAATVILNRFIERRNARGEMPDFEPCHFGFAMATGKAIVGNMGSKHRMDYTVCGRVVNLASRLENETNRGEVVIDNFTRMASQSFLILEALPTVQPKGFSATEKVTPHRIMGLVDTEVVPLRRTLKKVFSSEFFVDHLAEADLSEEDRDQWVHDAEIEVLELIASTPPGELFEQLALADA